jgi:hypothetical protein
VQASLSGAAFYANGKICISLLPVGYGLMLPAEVRTHWIERGDAGELTNMDKTHVEKWYELRLEIDVQKARRTCWVLATNMSPHKNLLILGWNPLHIYMIVYNLI